MTKAAMDQMIERRIEAALRDNDRRHAEIAEAVEQVRRHPRIGRIAMDGRDAPRSAADVFSRGLTMLGIDHAGIRDPLALKRMFELAPRPGSGEQRGNGQAWDVAPSDKKYAALDELFAGATRIERI